MTKLTTWGLRALGIAAIAGAAGLAKEVRGIPSAMGGHATGERAARMAASPHYRDGRFHNQSGERTAPGGSSAAGAAREMLLGTTQRRPLGEVPLVRTATEASDEGLFVTWFGHSSVLLEIDGSTLLLDPVWSDRVSPAANVGPKRMHPNPIEPTDLPRIDAVVISHDHYDHLDERTMRWLDTHTECQFIVPLGVGAHLAAWGVAESRIEDLDWDEDTKVGSVRVVATPAQHFSGRGFSRNDTQWASWAFLGPEHRVFYSGDGGYFGGFSAVGEEHGPFDLSLVQVGAYDDSWADIHMTPEDGVRTHLDVQGSAGGGLLLPVHWCTFNLALHAWSEPVERLLTEAERLGVSVAVPRPGERVDVSSPVALDHWWRALA